METYKRADIQVVYFEANDILTESNFGVYNDGVYDGNNIVTPEDKL